MNWLRKIESRQTPPGAELRILKMLPRITLVGTLLVLALLLLLAAVPVSAHQQTGQAAGFLTGLKHPVSGLDHVLAMISVGLWGAQLGAPALWLLPVVFPMVMAFGGFLGLLEEQVRIRNQEFNATGLRESLDQLAAAHDHGVGVSDHPGIVLAAEADEIDQEVSPRERRLQHTGFVTRQAAVPSAGSQKNGFKSFLEQTGHRKVAAHGLV